MMGAYGNSSHSDDRVDRLSRVWTYPKARPYGQSADGSPNSAPGAILRDVRSLSRCGRDVL